MRVKNLATVVEYLVDHCWIFPHDQHLDDYLSLSEVSYTRDHWTHHDDDDDDDDVDDDGWWLDADDGDWC